MSWHAEPCEYRAIAETYQRYISLLGKWLILVEPDAVEPDILCARPAMQKLAVIPDCYLRTQVLLSGLQSFPAVSAE